jgi:hypothetical protein
MQDQLLNACLSGPESLDTFISANGLRLGTALNGANNVMRLVLRSIVLKGASPALLGVLAKTWENLHIDEQTNAVTELVMAEHDLRVECVDDDARVRLVIESVVKEIAQHMPDFSEDKRSYSVVGRKSAFAGTFGRATLPRLALLNQAYNTFETIWPSSFGLLTREVLFIQHSSVRSHVTAVAQGCLARMSKTATVGELFDVWSRLLRVKRRMLNYDRTKQVVEEVNLSLMQIRICQRIFKRRLFSVEVIEHIAKLMDE